MKILLTGCMGFIGSNVTAHLLSEGHRVVGIDNLANPSIAPTDRIKQDVGVFWNNFKFYNCDIRQFETMQSIAVNERPDMIVHLAALGSVPRSFENPSLVIDVNERGFVNVVTMATQIGVKRVVFASSSSVYGDHETYIRKEGNEGNPKSPYALTKKNNEEFVKVWAKHTGLEFVGLRFFNVYGPGQLMNSAYSAVIPRFINDPIIKIFGDGNTIRDFTYVEDVARAIDAALNTKHTNLICNVGTGQSTSLNDLVKIILPRPTREIQRIDERPADTKASIADTYLAKSILGFESMVDIRQGLKKTMAFYQNLRNQNEAIPWR